LFELFSFGLCVGLVGVVGLKLLVWLVVELKLDLRLEGKMELGLGEENR